MKFSSSGWYSQDWYTNVIEAARYGFIGIEQLSWNELDIDKAKETLQDNNIINTAVIIESTNPEISRYLEWTHGMVYEDSYDAYLFAMRETINVCLKLGVPNIIATTGNERPDIPREKQIELCERLLTELARMVRESGLTLVLEPLNTLVDHKGYLLSKSSEAFDLVKRVNNPSLKVLFDIYHQQITEGNLIRNITENIDLIGHFHIADNPGRDQPGTGEINYSNVFNAIKNTGYDGWLAFECGNTTTIPELCKDMHELIAPFED